MNRISDALESIVSNNPLLQFGITHQLFNLSQLSKYLNPQIVARTKKEVKDSALLMALSRYQRSEQKKRKGSEAFVVKKLSVNSGLAIATFSKTPEIHRAINEFYRKVQSAQGFFTLSEGVTQITAIFDAEHLALRKKLIREKAIREYSDVGSLSVRFDDRYLETPGFLYLVLQQLYLQNLNILELTSTATELILFLKEEDVRLAFDTLYQRFK